MSNKVLAASAGNSSSGAGLTVEDVFSTYVYTGNGATQDIVNGINLADEGGMVWVKSRVDTYDHRLFDTERGSGKFISSNASSPEITDVGTLSSFNSDGFTLGSQYFLNKVGKNHVSWTFRKAPRFFDVVTWTGDGPQGFPGRSINHSLGVVPGCIIIKNISRGTNWHVEHRGANEWAAGSYVETLSLNTTSASAPAGSGAYGCLPIATDTTFNVVGSNDSQLFPVNYLGDQYIAYLFAHDPLGESGDGSDGMIACGSYTGDGNFGKEIALGWEAQYVLTKNVNSTSNWNIWDDLRGMSTNSSSNPLLRANTSDAEIDFATNQTSWSTSSGFAVGSDSEVNAAGNTYVYMAIRRPMKTPESAEEVFAIRQEVMGAKQPVGFVPDAAFITDASSTTDSKNYLLSRLTGDNIMKTHSNTAEFAADVKWDDETDYFTNSFTTANLNYFFKRAKSFFDVVCYTGTDFPNRQVPHNLNKAPEMMWVKSRNLSNNWYVYHKDLGQVGATDKSYFLKLHVASSKADQTAFYTPSFQTDQYFTLPSYNTNASSSDYIAYLFASLAGISKVGSFTGNGSTQTIACGFSTGTKFLIIKRSDADGEWYMWDSVRGIVTGNDPHLSLNTTTAEVTTDDSIDPVSTGFVVNQNATTNINVNSGEYIFYAIAE